MRRPSVGTLRGASLVAWLVPAGLVYFSLVGGTGPGELVSVLRLVNSAVGIGLIVLWIRTAPGRSDALDRWVLGALLLYLVSAVLAKAPHAAFEAAMATTAYAALFFLMRTAMSNPAARTRTGLWLGLTGVVVAAAYLAIWLMVWSGWLGAGQPTSTLFYIPLPGGPYGFKHNVALVAGLLIPFLWISSSGIPGRVQRVIGIGVFVPLLVMAGSRALWVGAVLATVTVVGVRLAARRRLPGLTRSWWLVAAAVLLALGAVVWLAPGLARAIADRFGNLLTLSARTDLWGASVTEWRTSPLTGVGPGGWPIWLPTTGYFDATAFSPRHPDSLLFQLLAEIGIAGVGALLLIAASVWRALRGTPPAAAIWAAVFFLVACITANPTDLAFAVVLWITWVSIATPRTEEVSRQAPRHTIAMARYALLGLIAVVVGASSAASILHDQAGQAAASGDAASARRSLDVAIALDPGLALYHREQGALALATGDQVGALEALRRASLLDPADDITMAELAVVFSLGGRDAEGIAAAARAVELRRSATVNHLVLAWVAGRAGRSAASATALGDSLVIAPWLAAADGWQALLHDNNQQQLLESAAARATTDPIAGGPGSAAWLAGMTGRSELMNGSAIKQLERDRPSLGAAVAVLTCDVPRAEKIIADADGSERATFYYWAVRAMVESAAGHSPADAMNLASILEPSVLLTSDVPATASAFGARADDQWVYDRIPIRFSGVGPALPSEEAGFSRWITDPRHAAVVAAPDSGLAQCND